MLVTKYEVVGFRGKAAKMKAKTTSKSSWNVPQEWRKSRFSRLWTVVGEVWSLLHSAKAHPKRSPVDAKGGPAIGGRRFPNMPQPPDGSRCWLILADAG